MTIWGGGGGGGREGVGVGEKGRHFEERQLCQNCLAAF